MTDREMPFHELADKRDLEFVQALNQGRVLLEREDRRGGVWDRLAAEVAALLDDVTGNSGDISYLKDMDADRIERPAQVDGDLLERARAALIALYERTDEEHAEHAATALADVRRAL